MLAGSVGAAGPCEQCAVGVQAVIVVWNYLVQIRLEGFTAGAGVIENHILNYA